MVATTHTHFLVYNKLIILNVTFSSTNLKLMNEPLKWHTKLLWLVLIILFVQKLPLLEFYSKCILRLLALRICYYSKSKSSIPTNYGVYWIHQVNLPVFQTDHKISRYDGKNLTKAHFHTCFSWFLAFKEVCFF